MQRLRGFSAFWPRNEINKRRFCPLKQIVQAAVFGFKSWNSGKAAHLVLSDDRSELMLHACLKLCAERVIEVHSDGHAVSSSKSGCVAYCDCMLTSSGPRLQGHYSSSDLAQNNQNTLTAWSQPRLEILCVAGMKDFHLTDLWKLNSLTAFPPIHHQEAKMGKKLAF